MSLITRMLKQRAAYWDPSTQTDDFGNPVFSTPAEIKCRWEDVHENFMDDEGNQTVSNAKVYVDRDLQPRGYLRRLKEASELGGVREELQDLDESPLNNEEVYTIRKFEKLPDRKADEFLRTAML